ncbi:MAG: O-antigen ligase family protein [Armatimonadetes bacterium]|nr:O-antigen ligase family protein [Armatimonadota bacterium]
MRHVRPEAWALYAAAFLAPLIGGQVSLEASPLDGSPAQAVLGGGELPLGARALIGLLVVAAFAVTLIRNRVVQIPRLDIAGVTLVVVAVTGFSVLLSAFPYVSTVGWETWVLYGTCLFAGVAIVGRRAGVRGLLWAVVAGTTLSAAKGVAEFGAFRATEPGHRIFSDWNNPNALAGILALALPLSLGLLLTAERAEALAAGACGTLMLFALVLTQSKGGILAAGTGLLTALVLTLVWKGAKPALRSVVPLVLAALLAFAATRPIGGDGGSGLSRLTDASATQEQSVGFRQLLWKGTADLVRERPIGFGIGTYRFESARPGLTEQTFHSHQTYLQTAMETGVPGVIVLVALFALWIRTFFSRSKTWPSPHSWLRAGVAGSVVAGLTDGLVESNLIYVGTGVTLFLVLGAGLQVSNDGSAPESTPKKLRWSVMVAGCAVVALLLVHAALVESLKVQALSAMKEGRLEDARSAATLARSLAPNDGEAYYVSSFVAGSAAERFSDLRSAAALQPSTKYLRAAAKAAQATGEPAYATGALRKALERDPNNLATLEALTKHLDDLGDRALALQTARRLVDVEKTVYFQVRAIPQLVPLETYDARVFLAKAESDPQIKAELLSEAVEGYATYFDRTVAFVKGLALQAKRSDVTFLGHDLAEAEGVAQRARKAAAEAKELYSRSGDSGSASKVDAALSRIRLD